MDSEVENCIEIANKLLFNGKYDEGEKMLNIARNLCSDPAKLQQIDDILKHYSGMAEESNTINFEKETVDSMTELEKAKQRDAEREIEIHRLSLMMREKVILMGIDVFASKPNYRPEVNFGNVKYELQYLIASSKNSFSLNDFNHSEYFMIQADNLYSEFAITLPEASLNSQVQNKPLNDSQNKEVENLLNQNDNTKNDNLNDPKTNNTREDQTSSTIRSYKVTVIGDEIDVARSLKIAETALFAGNLTKAEKWLVKAERMHPTEKAKDLLKQLVDAKLRVAEAATRNDAYVGEVEEATECFESNAADHTTEKKSADFCINIAQQALKDKNIDKAERFLMKAKKFNQELDVEYLQNKLQAAKNAIANSTTKGFSQETTNDQRFNLNKDYIQNSRKLVEVAKEALRKGKALKAKQLLLEAREYYDSMDIADLLDEAENMETQAAKLEETCHIAEPSYLDSNSETNFAYNAYDFSQPENSSRCDPTPDDIKKADNYVKTGRTALARNNLEKAERYAVQAHQLFPTELSKCLLDDIKKTKDLNKSIDISKLRSGNAREENVTTNTGVQTNSLKQEADMCLREAEKKLLQGNLNEAEDLVNKAQLLHVCESAKDLLQRIDAARLKNQPELQNINDMCSQPYTSNEWTVKNCNNESVQICIKKAESAFSENNFDKAEKLMKKAYRMFPDKSISLVLTKIQAEKEMQEEKEKEETIQPNAYKTIPWEQQKTYELETEQPYNNNIQEAEKCVQLAEQAYNIKNLDKAERLLLKAQRMDSTEYVENFLVKVQTEKQKLKNNTIPNEDDVSDEEENGETSTGTKSENQKKALQCINKAADAEYRENYYVAEIWLMKAEQAYPSDVGKELLENVRKTLKLNIAKQRTNNSHEHSEKKQEAKKYLTSAIAKFNQGDLESAQSQALISDCFVPSSQAKELMERILNEKFERDRKFTNAGKLKKEKQKKNNLSHDLKMFKADQYLEKAAEAMDFGNTDLAEEYLKKSIALNPSIKAKALLVEFRDAKSNSEPLSRVQKYLLKQLERLRFWK